MVQHFRPDRLKLTRSTPSTEGSDYDFVLNLRRTFGIDDRVKEVVGNFAHLTAAEIHASLMELSVKDDDALIALSAARVLNDRSAIRRAASVIAGSSVLSDAAKREAKELLAGKPSRTEIPGHGIIKVRGANSRLKRN